MSEGPTWDERNAILAQLESRRASLDQALWQAPALVIAAQAFLLNVLTAPDIDTSVSAVILVAGVAASMAAVGSLVRGRSREVLYADAIAYYFDKWELLLSDPRPGSLPRKPLHREGWWHRRDRGLQQLSDRWRAPTYVWWSAALIGFAIADLVAFFATTF